MGAPYKSLLHESVLPAINSKTTNRTTSFTWWRTPFRPCLTNSQDQRRRALHTMPKKVLEEFTTTSNPSTQQKVEGTQSRTRQKVPSIELITQMRLGFPIHKAMATQRGSRLVVEKHTYENFLTAGTPLSEINEFWTLHRAFPRVPQLLYPHKRPNVVLGNYLYFTQFQIHDKVNQNIGLWLPHHHTFWRRVREYK